MTKYSLKSLKKYLNRYILVEWLDFKTDIRTELSKHLESGLSTIKTNGQLVYIGKESHNQPVIVLCHEDSGDNIFDLTMIYMPLIVGVKKIS